MKLSKKILIGILSVCFSLTLLFGVGFNVANAEEAKQGGITEASVTLTDDIIAKFYYYVPAGYTQATVEYTYMGKTLDALTMTVTEGDAHLEFDGIQPARIGETVAVKLTLTGEGKDNIVSEKEFSVAAYLRTLLASSATELCLTQEQFAELKGLVANLANYAQATQAYIGDEVTAVDSVLNDEAKKLITNDLPEESRVALNGTASSDYGFLGANLALGGKVNAAFYIVAKTGDEAISVQVEMGGQTVATVTELENVTNKFNLKEGYNAYKAVWEGISVVDFGSQFTAKIIVDGAQVGQTATYSVDAYVSSMQQDGTTTMKTLAAAVYNYGLAVEQYLAAGKKGEAVELPVVKASLNGLTVSNNGFDGIDAGDSATFKFASYYTGVVSLSLKLSDTTLLSGVNLADVCYLKLNSFDKEIKLAKTEEGKVNLGYFLVSKGRNTLELCFKTGATANQNLVKAITGVEVSAKTEIEANNLIEKINLATAAGETVEYKTSSVTGWTNFGVASTGSDGHVGKGWVHASTTDGKNLYFYAKDTNASTVGQMHTFISRYDLSTKTFYYTDFFGFDSESSCVLFVYNGYVHTRVKTGKEDTGTIMRVKADFENGAALEETDFTFKSATGEDVTSSVVSAYYDAATKRFIYRIDNSVKVADQTGKEVSSFNVAGTASVDGMTGNIRHIAGDEKYVYVHYKTDGLKKALTNVYDYSGNFVTTIAPDFAQYTSDNNVNIQTITVLNGKLYATFLSWGSNAHGNCCEAAVNFDFVEEMKNIDLVEYLKACEKAGVTPAYVNEALNNGAKIPDLGTGAHGVCTDGEYFYIVNSSNTEMWVDKVKISTLEKVATTKRQATAAWENEGYLFYKDGTVYLNDYQGVIYELTPDEIVDNAEFRVSTLSFTGLSGTIQAISYDPTVNAYAILMDDGKVYAADGDTLNATLIYTYGYGNRAGIYCYGGYIYMFRQVGAPATANFNLIDFAGNVVKDSCVVSKLTGATVSNQSNVQIIFVMNGEYYFVVCQYGNGGNGYTGGVYITNVHFDTTVFNG